MGLAEYPEHLEVGGGHAVLETAMRGTSRTSRTSSRGVASREGLAGGLGPEGEAALIAKEEVRGALWVAVPGHMLQTWSGRLAAAGFGPPTTTTTGDVDKAINHAKTLHGLGANMPLRHQRH
jgi:hypothetical protein